jgi:hypothetical protein
MDKETFFRFDGYIVAAIIVVIIAIAVLLVAPLSVNMVLLTAAAGMLFVSLFVGMSAVDPKLWNWILFVINLALLCATWAAAKAGVS